MSPPIFVRERSFIVGFLPIVELRSKLSKSQGGSLCKRQQALDDR